MKIYYANDTPEGILTAIYEAWADSMPNHEIEIRLEENEQFDFFTTHVQVEASYEKAMKVVKTIQKRLGFQTWKMIEGALLANAKDKGQALFNMLRYGFTRNTDLTDDLSNEWVLRCFELNRKVRYEAHLLVGFVRFDQLVNGIYFSTIGPANDSLPLIADHFAERFNNQAFMIYDEKRKRSVVYAPGAPWYFVEGEIKDSHSLMIQDGFSTLWKTYFDTIAIKERLNPICQRNHCPIHFRAYMNEFQS